VLVCLVDSSFIRWHMSWSST